MRESVTIYVADDGTEFRDDRKACERHDDLLAMMDTIDPLFDKYRVEGTSEETIRSIQLFIFDNAEMLKAFFTYPSLAKDKIRIYCGLEPEACQVCWSRERMVSRKGDLWACVQCHTERESAE